MYELSDAIINVHSRKGIKDYEEVFSLCNRILDECTDTHLRYKAIDTLALAYDYAGKKDEMMKLTEQMPRANHTYERFMLYRWEGDKGYEEMQEYFEFSVYQILVLLRRLSYAKHDNGKFIYSLDERKKLWQMVIDFLDFIYPDGNNSQCMLDWITTNKDLDSLRSDPRYAAAVNRLKEYAFKP